MLRHPSCMFLVCFLSLLSITWNITPVHAQQVLSSNPNIQQGQIQYNAQNYSKAEQFFKNALRSGRTNRADRMVALRYLGFISVILGNSKSTTHYFTQLLKLDPKLKFDASVPPKFVRTFELVRKEYNAKRNVALRSLTSKEVSTETTLEVRIQATDHLRQVHKAYIYFRNEGESQFTRGMLKEQKNPTWKMARLNTPWLRFKIQERTTARCAAPQSTSAQRYFTFSIPKFSGRQRAYNTEFYIEAVQKAGKVIARLGSAQSPVQIKRTIPIKEAPKPIAKPITSKWWFWTAIVGGAAVVGAAVAIPVALANQGPPPAPQTGTAVVTVVQPTK